MAQNYKDLGINKMIASFFRNNDRLGYILLPIVAVCIWLFSLSFSNFHHVSNINSGFLSDLLSQNLHINFLIALNLIFTVSNSYIVTLLCVKHEITDKQNLLPGLFFILISGLLNVSGAFHPAIPAYMFLLFSLLKLFSIYREDSSLSAVFDASFLLSLAVLFYAPFIVFIVVFFIAMLVLKPFKIREWLLLIIGLITPPAIITALLFIGNSDPFLYLDILKRNFTYIHGFVFGRGSFLIHTALLLCFFLAALFLFARTNSAKIKTQKIRQIFLWFFVFGIFGIFTITELPFFMGILTIIPVAVFIGDYIGSIKKGGLREFLTLLLLAAYVCSNLQAAGYL